MKKYKNIFLDNRLNRLKLSLESDVLNLGAIKRQIDELASYKDVMQYDYYKDLIDPKRHGVKIPSEVPVPSCTFTLKRSIVVPRSGNFLIKYNPFFLASDDLLGVYRENVWVNNSYNYIAEPLSSFMHAGRVNNVPYEQYTNFAVADIGQGLPANVYSAYRLVSASINVFYQGPIEEAEGYLYGAPVSLVDQSLPGNYYTKNQPDIPYDPTGSVIYPFISRGGDFLSESTLRKQAYYAETNCLNGLQFNYFPLDNSFLEYVYFLKESEIITTDHRNGNLSNANWAASKKYYKSGFFWVIGAKGVPNFPCIRCDIESNFECLPAVEFMNYAPISVYPYSLSPKDMNEIITLAKDRCVNIIKRF